MEGGGGGGGRGGRGWFHALGKKMTARMEAMRRWCWSRVCPLFGGFIGDCDREESQGGP